MNVYEVTYKVQYATVGKKKKWWDGPDKPIWVLANGDARQAVKKAERHILRGKPAAWEDDDGKTVTEKPVGFRLVGVTLAGEIDVH